MQIMIVRARALAQVAPRVWIAVDGTLGASTLPPLRQQLAAWNTVERSDFFLDLTELRCAEGITADALRTLFTFAPHARLHLVGADVPIREAFRADPRCVLYPDVEAAWSAWE